MGLSINGKLPMSEIYGLWAQLTEAEKVQIRVRIGSVCSLHRAPPDWGLLTALVQRWDPETRAFNLAGHRLTPTIEEFGRILGLEGDRDVLARPTMGINLARSVVDILGGQRDHFERKIRKEGVATLQISDIQRLFKRHEVPPADGRLREELISGFVLAIFGLYLFKHTHQTFRLQLADIVHQVRDGRDFVPMILGELFLSLDRVTAKQKGTISCPALLYFWILSHMKTIGSRFYDFIYVEDRIVDNLPRIKKEQRNIHEWSDFFDTIQAQDILWKAKWMSEGPLVGQCAGSPIVPLIGVSGATIYFSLRAVRQHGYVQDRVDIETPEVLAYPFDDMTPPTVMGLIDRSLRDWSMRTEFMPFDEPALLLKEEKEQHATLEFIYGCDDQAPVVSPVHEATSQHQPASPTRPSSEDNCDRQRAQGKRPAEAQLEDEESLFRQLREAHARSRALENQLRKVRARAGDRRGNTSGRLSGTET